MKILYITNYFYPVKGGVENHIYYYAKELIKKGHQVTVFTSDSSRIDRIKKKFEIIDKIKVRRFKTKFKIGNFGVFFPGIFKAVKENNFDIINVHVYRHLSNFIPFFTNKPCLLTPHWPNYPKQVRGNLNYFLVNLFDMLFGKTILNRYKKLLMVSGLEEKWFGDKFDINKNKFELTPNGIPKDYLKKRNSNNFRKKLKINKNEIMVLMLSRIHQSKGFDQVVKIAKYFPKGKFVIAGIDGGFREDLEILTKNLNLKNVIFTGELQDEEKLEAYAAADIFVHPSHYEAFGIVVLEAFSQNCAVLTSNQGGLPWVVGNAGLTFRDNNLQDLRNKLDKLVKNKNLRNKLSKLGRKKAEKFTYEKIVNDVEKIYKKVV